MNSTTNVKVLLAGIGIVIIAGLSVLYFAPEKEQPFVGSFSPTGGGTYLLQSSISSTQTTITLTSFTEPGSGIPYTMAYINTNIVYGTLSPSSGNSEFISFTGITQNANGTATLTGVTRGQSRSPGTGGCVASTTLARAYPGQTQFILSNSPCFYSQFAVRQNAQSISGVWNFDAYPEASSTIGNATTSRQFVTFGQAQAIATQGAATGTESVAGIVRLGTALQAASSTYLGVDIPLVLQTKYATSSPTAACGLCVVVTNNAGKLAQAFIDLTQSFTWSGLHIFNAGFISNASSSVSSFNISSSTIFWNGKYVQPIFGGNGSDGALSITSGTTTVNLGNVSYYEKSYSSISITSTGHLAFSSPAAGGTMIVLKSQGGVTLTCSPAPCIDVSSLGATGAVAVSSGTGNAATLNNMFYIIGNTPAQGSASGALGAVGPAGTTTVPTSIPATSTLMKYGDIAWVGGGGGGGYGGNGGGDGGGGGNGGGGILIEVGGALNFTTAGGIYAVGGSNTNAPAGTGSCAISGAGGGGGGGGWVHILYNTLTANSGTINVSGGTGGKNTATNFCAGTYFGAGGGASGGVAGNPGTSSNASGVKTGGDGATGASRVEKNNDYF